MCGIVVLWGCKLCVRAVDVRILQKLSRSRFSAWHMDRCDSMPVRPRDRVATHHRLAPHRRVIGATLCCNQE